VKNLEATESVISLSPTLQGLLAINEATGFGDKNPDIELMHYAFEYHSVMPKTGFVYVPEIQPGDTVKVCLYRNDAKVLRNGTLAVYCDQGIVPEQVVLPYEPPPGQIQSKSGSGSNPDYSGSHVGRWKAIGYQYQDNSTTANMIWKIRDDGVIETIFPALENPKGSNKFYKIDTSASPWKLDLINTAGPNKDKTIQCIFKIDGDTLSICMPMDNVDDIEHVRRPEDFDLNRRSNLTILSFTRDSE
jgi:uncharacterized protein (TIGR03067 family)